jgi:integrase
MRSTPTRELIANREVPAIFEMHSSMVACGVRGHLAAPAEIRGLRWEDYDGKELSVRRSVWRRHVGETKTEGSAVSVPAAVAAGA